MLGILEKCKQARGSGAGKAGETSSDRGVGSQVMEDLLGDGEDFVFYFLRKKVFENKCEMI